MAGSNHARAASVRYSEAYGAASAPRTRDTLGASYGINDAIYRREDRATFHAEVADNPNTPENEHQPAHTDPPDGRFDAIGSGTADMAVYQLADPQGSVVAVLADAPAVGPRLVDEVEYEPYGRARRTAQGDFNHSGSITPQDNYDFLNAYFAAAPAGDADDGGTTTTDDVYAFLGEYLGGDTTPSDRISGWSVFGIIDNPYGYCGYYADHETAAAKVLGPGGGALYSVRFRVYDPIAGRWLTRDPAGFVDGMNLYEYCGGGAVGWWDPLGLSTKDPTECGTPAHPGGQDAMHNPQQGPNESTEAFARRQQEWWDLYYARQGHDYTEELTERVDQGDSGAADRDHKREFYEVGVPLAAAAAAITIAIEAGGRTPSPGGSVDDVFNAGGAAARKAQQEAAAGRTGAGKAADEAAEGGAGAEGAAGRKAAQDADSGVGAGTAKATRPKGTPADWPARPSKKGGGTKYVNPNNPHDYIRDMPGNPNSSQPAQQRPYVIHMRDGKALDKYGNKVEPDSPEAHIPRDEFVYRPSK